MPASRAGAAPARRAVPTTLVHGGNAGAREAAIAALLRAGAADAVILEGLADGGAALAEAGSSAAAAPSPFPHIVRIAPGCLCCSGNLVLRVTLNRVLRLAPAQLYISLANASHLEQLRLWLSDAPYGELLALQPDIAA
ncbi:GTPase [Rugamonas sp. CCM 8940]|nr:GTPase [Rugamonas sp. CCM 8940]